MNKLFTLIYGPDSFLVSVHAKKFWESQGNPQNIDVIGGEANTLAELEFCIKKLREALGTIPMFAEDQCVWLKNVSFLGDSRLAKSESYQSIISDFLSLIESIPSAITLLITASPVDKRTKAFKWLQKEGETHFVDNKEGHGLDKLVDDHCKTLGIHLTREAREILGSKIEGSSQLLLEEITKLSLYLKDNEQTIEGSLALSLVSNFGESDFFEPVEAFFSMDLNRTLEGLKKYFFINKEARPIIASLQNKNRLLIQLKSLEGKSTHTKEHLTILKERYNICVDDTKSSFQLWTQNPWYLGKLSSLLPKFTLKQLLTFQKGFHEAFHAIIEVPHHAESIMKSLATECLSPKQQKT